MGRKSERAGAQSPRAGEAEAVRRAVAAACGGPQPLLPASAQVLVACSGGPDSTALAAALVAHARGHPGLALRVSLGHVDHGLREGSGADAALVRSLAERLDVPCHVALLGRHEVALARDGLERAAREARYAALARLARQASASHVATAHTRRDQAETLLLRLARGAGPSALAGVRARRPLSDGISLVRPLLGVPRSATEALCAQLGLPTARDPHNEDRARPRTRVRALLPVLAAELNPRLEEALAGAAELLADEDDLLQTLAAEALDRARRGRDAIAAAELALLHPALARRALLAAANEAGCRPEREHLEAIRRALGRSRRSAWELHLPLGLVRLTAGLLRFAPAHAPGRLPAQVRQEVAIAGPGRYSWSDRLLVVSEGGARGTVVDVERAPFPWTLRAHRPGDRFRPGGGHLGKVSDQWIDARVPRGERARLPLLADASGILFWVEGLRAGGACRGRISRPVAFEWTLEMDGGSAGLIHVLR